MARTRQVLWLFATVLAASPQIADAATVIRTTSSPVFAVGTQTTTISFADITSADQLVSISAGGAGTPESGPNTFAIDVRYTDNTTANIYSQTTPGAFSLNFSSLPALSFASGNINALIFRTDYPHGGSMTIPEGTQFTFHVADAQTGVPEPIGWATMIGGFAAVGAVLRGRRRTPELSPG